MEKKIDTKHGKEFIIDSVQSFVEYVLKNQSKSQDVVYRGHASIEWDLKPSIGRKNYSMDIEKKVFLKFKMQYFSYTKERPMTDMELLFLAQHYGLPTRLLDWTYNPMIALYFACESNTDKDGCIYAVSLREFYVVDTDRDNNAPETMNQIISMEKSRYVVPKYTDNRYKNQKALFLLCSKPEKKFTSIKYMYRIKKESKEQIRKDLALLGYDRTLVYPMLDSLCEDIKRKYNLNDK